MSINPSYQQLMQEITTLNGELSGSSKIASSKFYAQKTQIENDMAAFYSDPSIPQNLKNAVNAAIQSLPDPLTGPNANYINDVAGMQSLSAIEYESE